MEPALENLTISPGRILLVETQGLSMWPALRSGDLLFGHLLRPNETPPPGTVLVVEGPFGLMAHRLQRCRGSPGRRRFLLAGDLSGADFPFHEPQVRGVAEAIYRRGVGFLDVPTSLGLGPIGRRLAARVARFWAWLEGARPDSAQQDKPAAVRMK